MQSSAGSNAGWLDDVVDQLRAEALPIEAVETHLCVAGQQVLIRYSEPELAQALGRATQHLHRDRRGEPALTIDCWSAPGPAIPPPTTESPSGTVHVGDDTAVLAWDAPDGPLFAYSRTERRAWVRCDSLVGFPAWEAAAPFRRILHWWAADRGLQLAHAAAVGNSNGGVLLVGRGGSGKSTTSLACLAAGLAFAGDDTCLLEPGDPPWVHGLYLSAKGDARTAELLPAFRDEFESSPLIIDGESVVFADRVRPDSISTGFPLRGIVVPRLSGESSSRLSPLSPAAALRALAPSSLLRMPGNKADSLQRLAGLVRDLPSWELTLGPSPAEAAALIAELVDSQVVP